uniref:ATP synthase subunit 8 n=1 Tax=Amblyomma postoculatum TaxID=3107720 RepID=UPI0030FEA5D2
MPQLFPMNWFLLNILMMFFILLILTNTYFIKINNIKNNSNKEKKYSMQKMLFKW